MDKLHFFTARPHNRLAALRVAMTWAVGVLIQTSLQRRRVFRESAFIDFIYFINVHKYWWCTSLIHEQTFIPSVKVISEKSVDKGRLLAVYCMFFLTDKPYP
jgi:hypothetical protein